MSTNPPLSKTEWSSRCLRSSMKATEFALTLQKDGTSSEPSRFLVFGLKFLYFVLCLQEQSTMHKGQRPKPKTYVFHLQPSSVTRPARSDPSLPLSSTGARQIRRRSAPALRVGFANFWETGDLASLCFSRGDSGGAAVGGAD